MPELRSANETIYYEKRGVVGGPPLLLLHSLGLSSVMWVDQLAWFSPRYTCLAPDCRGHGRSSHRELITRDAIVDDIETLLDHEACDAAHIVGISMGGVWALRLYERFPSRVRSLVLSDTFASVSDPTEAIRARAEHLATVSMAQFSQEYFAEVLKQRMPRTRLAQLEITLAGCAKAAYVETTRAIFTSNAEGVLQAVQVPTLVLVGELDDHTPLALSQHLRNSIPGAQLQVVPGAGHLSNLDNPQAFNAALDAFLAQLSVQT